MADSTAPMDQPEASHGTAVPSSRFDEKSGLAHSSDVEHQQHQQHQQHQHQEKQLPPTKAEEGAIPADEDEEEDIDALIEELESQDANHDAEEEDTTQPGGAKPVPDELLQTDPRMGLTSDEIDRRRKKYGLNQMKEEKENLLLKFLSYFVGPIQFVMEVSRLSWPTRSTHSLIVLEAVPALHAGHLKLTSSQPRAGCSYPCRRSSRLGGLWCHHRPAVAQCL